MHKKNIRALSLIVCTFTYLMLGAAVFDSLESGQDMLRRETLKSMKDKMSRKYNFTESDFELLEAIVVKGIPHQAGVQWKFAGAFYFATVVITTVGYGHSTPATFEGRMFCMLYAAAGIPLGLVMFQSIGERLNTLISFVLTSLKKYFSINREVSSTHLILVSSSVGGGIMMIGTYVFHRKEGWNLYDAYYYCFITMTTIGFGDYVALQKGQKLSGEPGYVVFTLVFILFGLAVFSASVNLFVLKFMATGGDMDANDREPAKTVLFETLSQRSSKIDVDDETPNGSVIMGKRVSVVQPKLSATQPPFVERKVSGGTGVGKRSAVRFLKQTKGRTMPLNCAGHCRCLRDSSRIPEWADSSKMKKQKYYTVRRAPTQISHLVNQPDDISPQETDSFLPGRRRTSF